MAADDDLIMDEIKAAGALLQAGDRAAARVRLEETWARIAGDPQPFHECSLAHIMADVQDVPADELAWDQRALDAALRCTDEDVRRNSEASSLAAFMPSLYASLGWDYYKLGELAESGKHLARARGFLSDLPNDAYGQLVRAGIDRLAKALTAKRVGPSSSG
jgi:hypothetical protein